MQPLANESATTAAHVPPQRSASASAVASARPLVFLDREEVRRRCGNKSVTWLYEQLSKGNFPRQVRYGSGRSVAWIESEIEAWLADQVAAARGQQS